MERGYVVKVPMYQGSNGQLVRNLKDAQLITDESLAESAANLAGGWVVPVVRSPRNNSKKRNKSNQAWMKG